MEMDRYIGVVDLSASGEEEIAYPFQRHLRIDLRTRSESEIESNSDLKNVIFYSLTKRQKTCRFCLFFHKREHGESPSGCK